MRKTNRLTRLGSFALILGGLGLTTPIISSVTAAADEARSRKTAAGDIAALRLMPAIMDPDIETEINRLRAAVVDGSLPTSAIRDWKGLNSNVVRLKLTENGPRDVVIYNVDGDELLGADKEIALARIAPLLELCAAHASTSTAPDYYKMPAGSTGLVYNAQCSPYVKKGEAELTADERIAGIMADEDLDYETRQAKALGVKIRAMIAEFRASTPNPTRTQYYDRCVYENDILNESYRLDSVAKRSQVELKATCESRTQGKYGARPE